MNPFLSLASCSSIVGQLVKDRLSKHQWQFTGGRPKTLDEIRMVVCELSALAAIFEGVVCDMEGKGEEEGATEAIRRMKRALEWVDCESIVCIFEDE